MRFFQCCCRITMKYFTSEHPEKIRISSKHHFLFKSFFSNTQKEISVACKIEKPCAFKHLRIFSLYSCSDRLWNDRIRSGAARIGTFEDNTINIICLLMLFIKTQFALYKQNDQ